MKKQSVFDTILKRLYNISTSYTGFGFIYKGQTNAKYTYTRIYEGRGIFPILYLKKRF